MSKNIPEIPTGNTNGERDNSELPHFRCGTLLFMMNDAGRNDLALEQEQLWLKESLDCQIKNRGIAR